MAEPLLVIEASGTHREVGRQIGEAARDLVAQGLAVYDERFPLLSGMTFAEAVVRGREYVRPAEDYAPGPVDQLRGVAEGANVPFERLFALNCSEEFTCGADFVWPPEDVAGGGAPRSAVRPAPEHCTSFALAAGGRVVSGHNEDWYPDEIDGLVVRHVRLAGGASYISAGPAYNMPLTGITAAGFTAAANTVYYRDERVGVPNNFLLSLVLEQPDLEHARDAIVACPRARGSNHLLCAAEGRIWDLETSAERWALVDASAPSSETGAALFTHSNHYVSPELAPGDASRSTGSGPRRERAAELLVAGLQSGADPVALGKAVLCDHEYAPDSICGHWDPTDPAEDQSVTTASMVWEPAEGRVHIARGQPCETGYTTYSL